jgi:hypothetical protein
LGGYFTYLGYNEKVGSFTLIGTVFSFGAKLAWNFNLRQNVLPYVGLQLGYNLGDEKYSNVTNLDSFSFGAIIGFRFFFADHIGAYIAFTFNSAPFVEMERQFLFEDSGLTLKF